MAQSQARRVYLERDIDVQMPATQENPGGSVRRFRAGWNDLDEQMASHPILSRLVPQDPAVRALADRRREVEMARDKAIGDAHSAYHQAMSEIAQEEEEARLRAAEEYGKRQEDAVNRGVAFNEPHPDPDTAVAMARTAPPAHVAAAAYMQRPLDGEEVEKSLPSEREITERQTRSASRAAGDAGGDKTAGDDKTAEGDKTARTKG